MYGGVATLDLTRSREMSAFAYETKPVLSTFIPFGCFGNCGVLFLLGPTSLVDVAKTERNGNPGSINPSY